MKSEVGLGVNFHSAWPKLTQNLKINDMMDMMSVLFTNNWPLKTTYLGDEDEVTGIVSIVTDPKVVGTK